MAPPVLRNDKGKFSEPLNTSSPSSSAISVKAISSLKTELMAEFSSLLKSFEERILEKFASVAAEVCNLRSEVQATKINLNKMTKRCENAEFDLKNLRAAFNKIESNTVAADAVIMNVPNNVDADVVVKKLFETISCEHDSVLKVFRTKKCDTAGESVPIILKLKTPDDRVKLFKSISTYRKKNNKMPDLAVLGLGNDNPIYLHECLSQLNKEILRSAIYLKKTKIIVSAFSLRGNVYIKTKIDGKPLIVPNIDELNKLVVAAN